MAMLGVQSHSGSPAQKMVRTGQALAVSSACPGRLPAPSRGSHVRNCDHRGALKDGLSSLSPMRLESSALLCVCSCALVRRRSRGSRSRAVTRGGRDGGRSCWIPFLVCRAVDGEDRHAEAAPEADSLKQVVIVHRHGARFPTKPAGPNDLSWPDRKQFWESNQGHLTPVGHQQLQDIGRDLRGHYSNSVLFDGVEKIDGNAIVCYTSNVQRTLQSAWSFLIGFLRDSAPIFFTFRSDRIACERERGEDGARAQLGVPIYIEDSLPHQDKLFHEWQLHDDYMDWRLQNLYSSPILQEMADDPKVLAFLDQLHEATGLDDLGADVSSLDRVIGIKNVDTLVMIERAHHLPILPNSQGIEFNEEEMDYLKRVGLEVKRCWFEESTTSELNQSFGCKGAAYLAHKIWRHLDERAKGRSDLRLVEFSCHDTTLAALANILGVRLPDIGFGAHFIFELHIPKIGQPIVRTYYNDIPASGKMVNDLTPRVLPFATGPMTEDSKAISWDNLAEGELSLKAMKEHCRIDGVEESFQQVLKLVAERRDRPTRERLIAVLRENKEQWLSLPQFRERYLPSFDVADRDGDGRLSSEEIALLMSEWGLNANDAVLRMLWDLFDLERHETVTCDDLYFMMATILGMRGSISHQPSASADSVVDSESSSSPLPQEVVPGV